MKRLIFSVLLAAVFWFVMFFPYLGLSCNFWLLMTCASLTLTTLAIAFGGWPRLHFERRESAVGVGSRLDWREFVLGVGIAIVLWGVFWLGDKCSQWLFDFARPQVDLIYGIKSGTPPMLIGLLLLLIIGPGEEIFWRGYVQRSLCDFFMEKRRSIPLTLARCLGRALPTHAPAFHGHRRQPCPLGCGSLRLVSVLTKGGLVRSFIIRYTQALVEEIHKCLLFCRDDRRCAAGHWR